MNRRPARPPDYETENRALGALAQALADSPRTILQTLTDTILVAMTGYGQDTDRQRSQEAGFDHHLVKPADFDQVQKILASVPEKAA